MAIKTVKHSGQTKIDWGFWATVATLVLAVILFYGKSLPYEFVYDDHVFLGQEANPVTAPLRDGVTLAGIKWAFSSDVLGVWVPFTLVSHMVDVQIFGSEDPAGHRFTNILLHALNAGLLCAFFRLLTGLRWSSVLAGALFAFHPQRVESVVWVVERKDVLCLAWMFVALIAYVLSKKHEDRAIFRGVALGGFALSLLAKPMAVSLPVLLLLLDGWPLNRLKTLDAWVNAIKEKWLYFAIAAGYSLLVLQMGTTRDNSEALPFLTRLAHAPVAACWYVWKTLIPTSLSYFYPHPGMPSVLVLLGSVLVLLALTVGAFLARKKVPALWVGWLWFAISLLPMIGILTPGQQGMADRFSYLPVIGLFLGGIMVFQGLKQENARRASLAGGLVILTIWAVLAWAYIPVWKNDRTLRLHALEVDPENENARYDLAYEQFRDGELSDTAATLQPLEDSRMAGKALLLKGGVLVKQGKLPAAVESFELAVKKDPRRKEAFLQLANLYHRLKKPEKARSYFEKAINDPMPGELPIVALRNYGDFLITRRDYQRALEVVQMNLKYQPDDPLLRTAAEKLRVAADRQ